MTTPGELTGLIPNDEGEYLSDIASKVPAELAIVELGSFRGKSTAFLAAGAKSGNGATVYAVDAWDLPGNVFGKHGYSAPIVREQFEAQLRAVKLWSRVAPIQQFTTVAAEQWDGPKVGLLFVDADHEEPAVRADIAAWRPHLAAGHVILLDDIDTPRNPGVRVVAEELVADGYDLQVLADRLAVLTPVR